MKKTLPWILLSILLGTGLLVQMMRPSKALKTAYITNAKLYSEFQLSIELNQRMEKVQTSRQIILDSLSIQLQGLERKIASNKASEMEKNAFEKMRYEYMLKQKQFNEDTQLMRQTYQEQISTQLNQYLKDFTAVEGYDYVFGATGEGSLMGAKDQYDVTDAVLKYANNRYKGVVGK